MGSIITAFKTGNLENVAKTFKEMSKAQQIAVLSSSALNTEQKQALATSAGLTITETGQVVATESLAGAQTTATATTSGLSAAMTGLGATLKSVFISLATNPFTYLVAGLAVGAVALHNYITAFDKASEKAQESQSAYSSTTQELSSLKSEAESYKDTLESLADTYEIKITGNEDVSELIQKLQSSDLSLEDRAQVEQIKAQNSELERQITLKQQLAEQQAKQTEQDAIDALKIEHTQDMTQQYTTYDKTGMVEHTQNRQTDIITASQNELEKLKQLKKDRQALFEDDVIDSKQTDDFEALDADIEKYTDSISSNVEQLNSLKLSFEDENGLMRSGLSQEAQDYYKQIVQIIDTFNNIDLTPAQQQLASIESFFDGSSGKNYLKDKLIDVAKNGNITEKSLKRVGLSLESMGLTGESGLKSLNDYFKDLISSANTAQKTINSVDGSFEGVKTAFEEENQDSKWNAMSDYLKQAKELYTNGKVGTDDFKTATQFLVNDIINADKGYKYDADAYVEVWKTAQDKVVRYFDSENPIKSATNFSDDLVKLNLATKDGNELTWQFKTTAEAAEKMGLSIDATEVLLHNLESYGAEFSDVLFSGESLDEYESSLNKIKELYDEMGSNDDGKIRLGNLIDNWDSEYEKYQEDLSQLTEDQIVHIEFEYSLAEIQSEINKLTTKQKAESGKNSETNASIIAANDEYISKAKQGTGLNKKGVEIPAAFKVNDDSLKDLYSQLEEAEFGSDEYFEIQAKIQNTQEIQKDLYNFFSQVHPEINAESNADEINAAWNDFFSKPHKFKVDGEIDQSVVEKQLGELAKGSSITFTADVDGVEQEVTAVKQQDGTIVYMSDTGQVIIPDETLNKNGTVTFTKDSSEPDNYEVEPKESTVKFNPDFSNLFKTPVPTLLGTVKHNTSIPKYNQGISHRTEASGTLLSEAFANGTAFNMLNMKPAYANGKVALDHDELAVVNELGTEGIIRNGRLFAIPGGMHMQSLKKGDIILSANQMKNLFSGKDAGHARAYAEGTFVSNAYSDANGWRLPSAISNSGSPTKSSSTQNAVESAAETVSDTAESVLDTISNTTDWIERKIEVASKATEKAVNALEESVTFSDKMANNEAAIQKVKNELYWNQLGANRYREFEIDIINKTGLSSDILDKIYNGAIELSDYDEDTRSKIEEYTKWYDKTQELLDNIEELRKQEKELALERVEYVKDWYDALTSIQDAHKNLGEARVDLATDQGKNINDSEIRGALNYQLTHTQEYLALQQRERDEMWAQMMRLLSEGYITAGDDNYNDMLEQIYELDASIIKSKSDIIDIEDQFRKITYDQIQQAIAKYERITERNEAVLSLLESKGYVANENEYIKNIKANEEQIKQIEELISQKQKEQSKYEIGSERYEELADEINELDISMINLLKDNEDLKKSIRDIKWDSFDKLQESITAIIDEADYLIDLMSEDKMFNDNGSMTDQAKAIVGLHGVNYNAYMNQAEKYKAEMKSISEELANDPNNQDLIDRRKELLELQRESILAAEDEKQAMKDLVKDGIDETLDALKELISKYEDALDSQKDLRDFEKDIANKQEKIASYEKQLKAYENDTSEEGAANRQQIQNALKEAREDLDDTMYDRSISDQKKLLDNLYDEYEELLNKRLDNIDQLISEMIDNINMDSSLIIDTIKAEAEAVGYILTDDMLNIWNNNGDVGKIISVYDDKFMDTVTGVKSSIDDIKTLLERVVGSDILNLPDYSHKEETESTTDTENNNFAQEVQKVQSSIDAIRERIKDRMELSKEVLVQSKSSASELAKNIRDSLLSMGNNADVLLNTQALQQQQLFEVPQLPVIPVKNNSTVQQNIEMNVAIERVMDYNDFLSQLRNDSKFEKLIHAITIDQLDGGSSLSKYNIRI